MELTTLYLIFTFVALAVVLMGLIEVFFIPGTGLLGILSAAVYVATIIYLWSLGQWGVLLLFVILSIVAFALGFFFLSKSKWVDKMSLSKRIEDKAVDLPNGLVVGAEGRAESRLALSGRVRVGNDIFEATSESGLIDEKTPVVVTRIERDKVFVQSR